MSVKTDYIVRQIPKEQSHEWLLKKHYAHRIPPVINFAFGIYDISFTLIGIMTYGLSGNINNNKLGDFNMLELTRLVIKDNIPNLASYFISNTFNLLPKPLVLISYSDKNVNHHGYIYQATNWIYTGLSSEEPTYMLNDIGYHRKTLYDIYGTSSEQYLLAKGYQKINQQAKHRYFYFLGNKQQKRHMLSILPYAILPYPKGDNVKYDASYQPPTQGVLV